MSFVEEAQFDIMHGLYAGLKTRMDMWEVPGLNGYGAQTLGKGDGEFPLVTIVYMADNDSANEMLIYCESLQGSIISIQDDWGDNYFGVAVKQINTQGAKTPVIFNGNASAVRVMVNWLMVATLTNDPV